MQYTMLRGLLSESYIASYSYVLVSLLLHFLKLAECGAFKYAAIFKVFTVNTLRGMSTPS